MHAGALVDRHPRIRIRRSPATSSSMLPSGNALKYNPSVYITPASRATSIPITSFGTRDRRRPDFGLKVGKSINQYFDVPRRRQLRTCSRRQAIVHPQQVPTRLRASTACPVPADAWPCIDGLFMLSLDRFRSFLLVGIGAENDRRNLPNFAELADLAVRGRRRRRAVRDFRSVRSRTAGRLSKCLSASSAAMRSASDRRTAEQLCQCVGLTYYFDKSPTTAPPSAHGAGSTAAAAARPHSRLPRRRRRVSSSRQLSATELFAFDKARR